MPETRMNTGVLRLFIFQDIKRPTRSQTKCATNGATPRDICAADDRNGCKRPIRASLRFIVSQPRGKIKPPLPCRGDKRRGS